MGSDSLGNGVQATQERFAGQRGYRGGRRGGEPVSATADLKPGDGGVPNLEAAASDVPPRPSLADLDVLTEPVLPTSWLDPSPAGSLADHPLLRGLLLELPPKGMVPAPGWLDRWFEAARAILELLYVQEAPRR